MTKRTQPKRSVCLTVFFAIFLSVVLLFPTKTHAVVEGTPADDSTFYVSLVSDGPGVPMMLLPTELGLSYMQQYFVGAMGALVSNGAVVEETNPANMENTHNKKCGTIPGWACSGNFKVGGTYKSGHLTIISTSDETYTYDGTPIEQGGIYEKGAIIKTFAPVPIAPEDVTFKSETRYECDVESANTFACSMTRAFVKEPAAECIEQKAPPYPGAYGWDICAKARYSTKPQETKTGTAKAFVAPLNGMAIVGTMTRTDPEDVEVTRASGEKMPARLGTVVKAGDSVSTGFDAKVVLDFGYATLDVWKLTLLTIDEYTNKENIEKTQLNLHVGSVQATVKHTAAIRSDFSVATPGANASIRDSEMRVSYDENTKETTVIALEDKAYVKGTADANEIEVPEKKQITVDANGKAGTLVQATAVPGSDTSFISNRWIYGGVLIVLIVLAYVVVKRWRKKYIIKNQ